MQLLSRCAGLSLVLVIAACAEGGGDGDRRSGDGGPVDGGDAGSQPGDGGQGNRDGGAGMDGGGNDSGSQGCSPEACPSEACGYVADGCGGFLTCGMCPDGQVCGLFEPVRCGAVSECSGSDQCQVIGCTPQTCASLGHTC